MGMFSFNAYIPIAGGWCLWRQFFSANKKSCKKKEKKPQLFMECSHFFKKILVLKKFKPFELTVLVTD